MKRLLTLLPLAFAVAACGGSETGAMTPDGKVLLRYQLWDTNQKPVYQKCADKFQQANPGELEVVSLLESGKNVVASPNYHFPQLRGAAFVRMLEDACRKGGVSLYGTGINPGWLTERMAPLLTSFSNEIDYVRAQEYFNLSHVDLSMLKACTIGMEMERAKRIIHKIEEGAGTPFYYPAVAQAVHVLGHELERIDVQSRFTAAREDLYLSASGVTISKGNVAC